jgi:hypothetical protein
MYTKIIFACILGTLLLCVGGIKYTYLILALMDQPLHIRRRQLLRPAHVMYRTWNAEIRSLQLKWKA